MKFHLNIVVMKHALILLFGLLAGSHLQAQEALVCPMPSVTIEIAAVAIPLTQQNVNTEQENYIGCSCCSRPAVQKPLPARQPAVAVCSHGPADKHDAACYAVLPCGHTPIQHRDIACDEIVEQRRDAADVVLMVLEENHNIPPR